LKIGHGEGGRQKKTKRNKYKGKGNFYELIWQREKYFKENFVDQILFMTLNF
jgi:hypothetical protein